MASCKDFGGLGHIITKYEEDEIQVDSCNSTDYRYNVYPVNRLDYSDLPYVSTATRIRTGGLFVDNSVRMYIYKGRLNYHRYP